MKFTVQFETLYSHPFDLPSTSSTNIHDVDFIRKKVDENIPMDKINYPIRDFDIEPVIELDEDKIRKLDVFYHLNEIKVYVPIKSLNKYIYKDVYIKEYKHSNNIKEAGISYKLDEKKLIEDWIEDGAPMKWGMPVEEEKEKKGLIDKIKDLFK